MYERMHILTEADKDRIHAASQEILKDMGINFLDSEAIEIFKHHGFKVDGAPSIWKKSRSNRP